MTDTNRPSKTRSICWLIEHREGHGWLHGSADHEDGFGWSKDPDRAIRFCRKIDAEWMMTRLGFFPRLHFASEHVFLEGGAVETECRYEADVGMVCTKCGRIHDFGPERCAECQTPRLCGVERECLRNRYVRPAVEPKPKPTRWGDCDCGLPKTHDEYMFKSYHAVGCKALRGEMPTEKASERPAPGQSLYTVSCARCSGTVTLTGSGGRVSLSGGAGWYFSTETGWLCPADAPK